MNFWDEADIAQSHNISATAIRLDAEARRAATVATPDASTEQQDSRPVEPEEAANADAGNDEVITVGLSARNRRTTAAQEAKRKKEQRAIEKIKASKRFQKRKRKSSDDDDEGDNEDEIARAIFQARSAPLPGQMENCSICSKRFTVTAYSRNAPEGGLLCNPCGRELDKDNAAPRKRTKRIPGAVSARRQVQSKILDGTYHPGAKSLMTLCIETVAKNIDLAEDLGDLPVLVIDKIARKLSKHRLLDSRTLSLFLQPSAEDIFIYEGAKLTADDYIRVFLSVPNLRRLKICNAIHFKDEVMDFLLSRHINLESFHLHGANLLSESKWKAFLEQKGQSLKALKVYWTDHHFGDSVLALLPKFCPSLTRLKVEHNQQTSGEGLKALAKAKSLRHLSLDLRNHVHSDIYVTLIKSIGKTLETLSLTGVHDADNSVLDALHNNCQTLTKLRITDSEVMTDEGFTRLFTDWTNKPLSFIDFQKCRQLDSVHPRDNPDGVGFCSNGFRALMTHSGRKLQALNIYGCRHITVSTFEEVFSADNIYPELIKLEISFCEQVTDFIVGSIFRSCPKLRELIVFGCMKVKGVVVPRGKLLIGVPNAVGMVIDGNDN